MKRSSLGMGLLGWLLVGCASVVSPASPPMTGVIQPLSIPAGDYFGLAWLDDSIVMASNDAPGSGARLVAFATNSTSVTPLPFESSSQDCWRVQEVRPTRLPDGRLGFVQECQPTQFKDIDASVTWHDIIALDLTSGDRAVLAHLGDPEMFDGSKRNLYSFSYRPDLQEGAAYFGTLICDGIARFDRDSVAPFDFPLGEGSSAPNLNEPFTRDCEDAGNARLPEWSPDGRRLAVLISDTEGRDGQDRLDLPWDLVVLDPASGAFERRLTGLHHASDVRWSPDGDWLLVGESEDGEATTTLWLVDTKPGGPARRVALDDRVVDIAWSPDGMTIAGLIDPTGGLDPFTVMPVTIDLSAALSAESK